MTDTPRPVTPPPVAGPADRAYSGDTPASSDPADAEEDPATHLARVPDCWLCVAVVGGAGPAWGEPVLDRVPGPSFVGAPVLATDASVVVAIGADASGATRVWCGPPQAMEVVGELDPSLRPVAMTRHEQRWHLVATDEHGRSRHLVSSDLVGWREDTDLVEEAPNFAVRGITATSDGLVLLGEVVVRGRRVGWTLLDTFDGALRARELRIPVTAEHRMYGPVAVGDDGIALVVSSGGPTLHARSAAGSGGRAWTIALVSPDVVPIAAMGDGGRLWVAGRDPVGGAPMVVDVARRGFHLDRRGGDVLAAVVHRGELVMARRPLDAVDDPPAWMQTDDDVTTEIRTDVRTGMPAGLAAGFTAGITAASAGRRSTDSRPIGPQSRPAYIDSISVA